MATKKNQTQAARDRGYVKGSYGVDAKGNRVSVNSPGAVGYGGGAGGPVRPSAPTAPAAPAPTPAGAAPSPNFSYVDRAGAMKSVYASSPEEALRLALDRDPRSGVQSLPQVRPPAPGTGVGTSDPVRAEERAVTDYVQRARARGYLTEAFGGSSLEESTRAAKRSGEDVSDLLYDRMRMLDRRRSQESERIDAQFGEARRGLDDSQARERATTSTGLATIGGYLGGSASGMGAMANLQRTHEQEILSLEAKRQDAILAAENAIADQQFDLAKEYAKSIRDTEAEVQRRRETFFNQTLQYAQAMRQDDEYRTKQANEALDRFALTGEAPDPETLYGIAESLGATPDGVLSVLDAKRRTRQLEEAKSQSQLDIQILNALSNVPRGSFVTIGGQTYEGMEAPAKPTSGDVKDATWRKFIKDAQSGEFDKKTLVNEYAGDLSLSDMNGYFQTVEGADIQAKLDAGEYDYDGKDVIDAKRYKAALDAWGKNGGGIFRDDDTVDYGGKSYKGPADTMPDLNDFLIRRDIVK